MDDITIYETLYQCYSYNQQVNISYNHRSYYNMYSNTTNGYYYEYFCPGSELNLQFASPNPLSTEHEVCRCCNRIDSFFLFNRNFNIAVDYFMEMCSLLGLSIGLGFVILFLREKSLRTPYGILCFWQALFDFILLALIGLFETPINFLTDMWNVNRFSEVPHWLRTYVFFVLEFWPNQPFLMFSAKTVSMLMRLMKTGVRLWALYFPISYQMKLTNKLALQGIFLVTTLVILLFIPQLIILTISNGNVCHIELFYLYSWDLDICSSIYHNINTYSDGLIAILCFTLDILCIIKFRKIYANNTAIAATSGAERTRRRQEKIMIIQNCANISVFICAYIPLFISMIIQNSLITQPIYWYKKQCDLLYFQNIEFFQSAPSPYKSVYQVLIERSLKRSIGHMLDGAFTLYLQYCLARANKGKVTMIQVISTIVPTPIKLTHKEKFQKFLARL